MLLVLLILNATPLEAALAKPDHTKKLNLSKQNIDNIPTDIGKLKKLTDLDLSYNPIEALPLEIGDLAQLESLSLRCTKLKKLPETLSKLTKLKRLDVSSAMDCEDVFRLTPQAAGVIGKIPSLSELRIAFVHAKSIPVEVLKLPGLRVLDVSYNEIATLPKSWPPDLEDLDLSGNELQKTPDVSALKKLQKLSLGGQRGKKTIPADQIEALKKQMPNTKIITD